MASARDAFAQYLVPPDQLSHAERVDLMKDAVPALRFGELSPWVRAWWADAIDAWLNDGGGRDLEHHLGLRPPRGSKRRAANVFAMHCRDRLLLQMSVSLGSDARAMRVLNREIPCPKRALPLLEQFEQFSPPGSAAAFTRARKRLSRHRR